MLSPIPLSPELASSDYTESVARSQFRQPSIMSEGGVSRLRRIAATRRGKSHRRGTMAISESRVVMFQGFWGMVRDFGNEAIHKVGHGVHESVQMILTEIAPKEHPLLSQ